MIEATMTCRRCDHKVVVEARDSMIAVDEACKKFFRAAETDCDHTSGVVQTRDVKKDKIIVTLPYNMGRS